jgi:hypothetical protein
MFNLNQVVQHKKTGKVGKVVGYGYKTSGNAYFLTLKVRLLKNLATKATIEDITNEWFSWQQDPQRFWQQKSAKSQIAA